VAVVTGLPPGGSFAWTLALLLLVPPLVAALAMSWRGPVGTRFVAVQLAGSVGIVAMAAMTFAFDQPSSVDLAVTFGVLSVTASLLYAVFAERWV
jgi:multisubunit Na+/H+ antiporter MnhF subunit